MTYHRVIPTSKANAKMSIAPIITVPLLDSSRFDPGHAHSGTNSSTRRFMEPNYSISNLQDFDQSMQYQNLTADSIPISVNDFFQKDKLDEYMASISSDIQVIQPEQNTNNDNYGGGIESSWANLPVPVRDNMQQGYNTGVLIPPGFISNNTTNGNTVTNNTNNASEFFSFNKGERPAQKYHRKPLPKSNKGKEGFGFMDMFKGKKNNEVRKGSLSFFGTNDASQSTTTNDAPKMFVDIQPNMAMIPETIYPINNNLAISWVPEQDVLTRINTRTSDQTNNPYAGTVLYDSIDPQLIRHNLPKERQEEMPKHYPWSDSYSNLTTKGSVNWAEDIYDPRFTSYGAGTRAYQDIETGNIQYYYSDVEAYRDINYISKSKVDFLYFKDPNGKIIPEYKRDISLEDMKKEVHSRFDADQLFFRENLSGSQSQKMNARSIQLQLAPHRQQGSHTSFSSGPNY